VPGDVSLIGLLPYSPGLNPVDGCIPVPAPGPSP
jgi:hypothetical protein